jgi:hypothetical protein
MPLWKSAVALGKYATLKICDIFGAA